MSNNIYRDYQPRLIGEPKLRNSSMFNQEMQSHPMPINDRRLMQDYEVTPDEYSLLASPGSQRRAKSYSNDPIRNPFLDDNHRINIVVSSPQRYVMPKRRLDEVLHVAPTLSSIGTVGRSIQNQPPQYWPTTTESARHSADPAWASCQIPLVDHRQQMSPSSIGSQSGWSALGGGSMQEGPDQTSSNYAQRTMNLTRFSSTSASNPGDKPTQRYQSGHKINSIHYPVPSSNGQHRAKRDWKSELGFNSATNSSTNVSTEKGIFGQYAATSTNTLVGEAEKQISNQCGQEAAIMDQYGATSGSENADSNSKVVPNALHGGRSKANNLSAKTMAGNGTASHGGFASAHQKSNTHTEAAPTLSSGCPLFAGR